MCPVYDLRPCLDVYLLGNGDYYETLYFVDDNVTAYITCDATSMKDSFHYYEKLSCVLLIHKIKANIKMKDKSSWDLISLGLSFKCGTLEEIKIQNKACLRRSYHVMIGPSSLKVLCLLPKKRC